MKLGKISVLLALLGSTHAMAEPFFLSCEFSGGDNKKQEITLHVDEQEKAVNGRPAVFTQTTILFETKLTTGTLTSNISRVTGYLTLTAEKEIIATGQCAVVTKRKF